MYSNSYIPNVYSPQASIDRINNQIAELERLKSQIPAQQVQPTNLTQNFQIAPNNNDVIKYANSIDEVQKNIVIGETPYFSKDMSVVWVKDNKGNIKVYELNEIIQKDEKDLEIEYLKSQIDELKKGIHNEQLNTNVIEPKNAEYTEEYDEPIRNAVEKKQPTSVSRISASKKK